LFREIILFEEANMKVGILGAGNIAGKMAQTLNLMSGTEPRVLPYGIASRDYGKAKILPIAIIFKRLTEAMRNSCRIPRWNLSMWRLLIHITMNR
jgi:hypothetical protein